MPSTPDDAFRKILERIEKQESNTAGTAKQTLAWLYYARRPLKMEELCDALSIEDNDHDRKDNYIDAIDIVDCNLSFVTHDESTGEVRFIHPSVERWFNDEPQHGKLLPRRDLAKKCLTYLAFDEFNSPCPNSESMEKRTQKYKFSLYAAQFWGLHTRGEAENEPDIQRTVLSLLASENKRNSMLQMETYANSSWGDIFFTKGQTLLHVIAKNGLATICRFILDECNKGELQSLGMSQTDTDVAAKDNGGRMALHWAARGGHKDVVALLLDKGADVAATDIDGGTALHWAAEVGHKDVVALLLDKGADVAAMDIDGRTALHWATQGGHKDVVALLLDKGADVAATEANSGWTALHWAAEGGHKDVFALLKRRGA